MIKEVSDSMKKFIFTACVLALAVTLFGCGRKQQPISETQEPISIEDLSKLDTSVPASEMSSTAPVITVTPSGAPDAKLEQLPPSGPYKPSALEIQTALKNAGYYEGSVDGKIGPQTKKAVEDFQKANGLKVDGKVGPMTWSALGKYLTPKEPLKKR